MTALQLFGGAPDVDHDEVLVERLAFERGIDDVGRAVQLLRWSEHLAAKTVGDHDVIADRHAEHVVIPRS